MANKNVKEINVKIEGKAWEDALDKAFKKANSKAKIDGFRAGHAPKEVFLKKYGVESLYMDACDGVIEEAYKKMLDDNKDIEIVAQPEINIKSVDEKHVEFIFTLTLKPEVKLGKYKGIDLEEVKYEVQAGIDLLKEKAGIIPEVFAYPFGSATEAGEREFNVLANMPFVCSCIATGGACTKGNKDTLSSLPRVMIKQDFTINELK